MRWFPKSGPRRTATAGIAAKSKRGSIGDTWWSKRFVAVLESYTQASRLQRGRSYARSGQVSELRIAPGVVTAKVQGSRARPYDVRITATALTDAQWATLEQALADQALFAAALLAGELPHEIEGVFAAAGHPLFPSRAADVRTACSCPDYANPCKHVAATYYLLAERFDADPFAILAWRGRDREALVAGLRARRTVEPEPVAPEPEPAAEPAPGVSFWTAGSAALALTFRPDLGAVPDALARRLGPLESGGVDLAGALAPAWARIAEAARKRALEG